jgi:hypothetical protein
MLPGPGSDQFLLGSRRRNEIRVTDEAELNIDAISAQIGESSRDGDSFGISIDECHGTLSSHGIPEKKRTYSCR